MALKLGVGTVQFGLNYGVSNTKGQTESGEVCKILELARRSHIGVLDTAASYGESEAVLGQNAAIANSFRIITKTNATSAAEVVSQFSRSLERLKRSSVDGLLVHHCKFLLGPDGPAIYKELQKLKEQGLVKKIGASTYYPEEVDAVLEKFDIDLIQVPINILDQRLLLTGRLDRLKQRRVEVHARSAFLQGLLLMPVEALPKKFLPIYEAIKRVHVYASQNGISVLEMALAFVQQQPTIDVAICGVNDIGQFEALLESSKRKVDIGSFAQFAIEHAQMLDPTQWEFL